MERKLATIQKITAIDKIPNADNIVVASILGWKVVVKRDEFNVGDLVVYCEIDSFLPVKPEFEFLREYNCFKKNGELEGFRIKTVKLRQQVSQGICFPLSIFKDMFIAVEEGMDVSDILGIVKYLLPIPENMKGLTKGNYPSFGIKSDEPRVQNLQEILTKFKGTKCVITEKIDGGSATYYIKDGEFGVCSHHIELKETDNNLFWKVAREQKIEEKLRSLGKNVMIIGELCGIGINKNLSRITNTTVLFFDAFDVDKFKHHSHNNFVSLLQKLELQIVPIIESNYVLDDDVVKLVEKSKGYSMLNPKMIREGIIIRQLEYVDDSSMYFGVDNNRLSFKVLNPDYLLKFEE